MTRTELMEKCEVYNKNIFVKHWMNYELYKEVGGDYEKTQRDYACTIDEHVKSGGGARVLFERICTEEEYLYYFKFYKFESNIDLNKLNIEKVGYSGQISDIVFPAEEALLLLEEFRQDIMVERRKIKYLVDIVKKRMGEVRLVDKSDMTFASIFDEKWKKKSEYLLLDEEIDRLYKRDTFLEDKWRDLFKNVYVQDGDKKKDLCIFLSSFEGKSKKIKAVDRTSLSIEENK